jgi:hypothetical protein
MAGPSSKIKFHPASFCPPNRDAVQTIPLTLGADVDLTLTTTGGGQTNGYCARSILNGGTAGNLGYYDTLGQGPFVQALAAYERFPQGVSYIVNASTTCNPSAEL